MKRLIAVAVIGNWTGPWHPAQRGERSAIASPLAEGEGVVLEVEHETGTMRIDLSHGPVIFPSTSGWKRYRVVKSCAGAAAPIPTTVEIMNYAAPMSSHADHT